MADYSEKKGFAISCYYNTNKASENFVAEHTLSYLFSGSLILDDGTNKYNSTKGSFRLIQRNHLIKSTKQPSIDEPFKSLSIYLDQRILKNFAMEYGIEVTYNKTKDRVVNLNTSPLVEKYIQSVIDYTEENNLDNQELLDIKIKEGILLLLQFNPQAREILFDFSEPYKVDLELFMNQHYHFNIKLERFAYLTGRSLATFKRDFEKQFGITPGKWLTNKRLDQARKLLSENGKSVSDIYLDLGFENLSHFSFAFKKQFGITPTELSKSFTTIQS